MSWAEPLSPLDSLRALKAKSVCSWSYLRPASSSISWITVSASGVATRIAIDAADLLVLGKSVTPKG
jgi:hypothetical protein